MAKLFYTAEEAATKLGKSVQELMDMAKSGQLQEFKDRDRSLFKVEAVDQLADSGSDMVLDLKLTDSSTASEIDLGLLDDSGPGIPESPETDLSDVVDPSKPPAGDMGDELLLADDDLLLNSDDASSPSSGGSGGSGGDVLSLASDDDLLGLADDAPGLADSSIGSRATPAEEVPASDIGAFDLDLGLGASGSHAGMGLADSGSPVQESAPITASDDLGDLGLDLGLDLDDAAPPQAPASGGSAGGVLGLADSGSMAGAGGSAAGSALGGSAALSSSGVMGASGSRAAAGSKAGQSGSRGGLLDDSLAGSSMVGGAHRESDGMRNLETVGSGSGLLDLTKESDESTIGAALLDEVVEGDDGEMGAVGASGIFADAGVGAMAGGDEAFDTPAAAMGGGLSLAAAAVTLPETLDGGGSGLTVGLMAGAMASLLVAALVLVPMTLGAGSQLGATIASDLWMWAGALAGGTAFCGVVGFFIGRQLE